MILVLILTLLKEKHVIFKIKPYHKSRKNDNRIGHTSMTMIERQFSMRNKDLIQTRNFYKIFKFIIIQMDSGANPEQIFKVIYKIADDQSLKNKLYFFSAMITQNHQLSRGIEYLRKSVATKETMAFIDIFERLADNTIAKKSLSQIDQILFQKYLSGIKDETKKIEKSYLYIVIMFTVIISLFLLLPLLSQMVESADMIFK